MSKSNSLLNISITVLISLFLLNISAAQRIFEKSENDLDSGELSSPPHVIQLTKQNVEGRIQYVLGNRIAGDNLVAHSAKNQTWPSQQNVAITLTYPTAGIGKQVTYVAIQVDQTSNTGQAYVISGGLHQRSIAITVEAYTTYVLNYDAQIYGV